MSPVAKVPTGVPGLDRITHGGLPKGRTTLITGKSGAAKSILALQLASSLARSGLKTVVFAVEESPADLLESGNNLGFGLSALVEKGTLKLTDLTRPPDTSTIVTGDYDVTAMVHRVEEAAKTFGASWKASARSRRRATLVADQGRLHRPSEREG